MILAHVVFELTGLPATELFPAPPFLPLSRIYGEGIFPFLASTPYATHFQLRNRIRYEGPDWSAPKAFCMENAWLGGIREDLTMILSGPPKHRL